MPRKRITVICRGTPTDLLLEDDADLSADIPRAVWVQIAQEGQFAGYRGGSQPFEFTRETFDQIVKNFRNHPTFEKGSDGLGTIGVVPWDFNHASEQDPTVGALPTGGAPAQGWTVDLDVRLGVDGRSELWALTNWLEPARGYIQSGRYKWASVAVAFESIDPRSGANVGAVLTSVAMTNQPFIEGMQKLAAGRGHFEPASSPTEAFESFRDIFALPATTGLDDVMSEIAKLEQWVTVGNTPIGVDVGEIVGKLRTVLNLPALTDAAGVVAQAGMILEGVIQEQVGLLPPANTEVPPNQQMMVSSSKEMDQMDLKILASKFGVRESDLDDAVNDAVELRSRLTQLFKLKKSGNAVLLQEVEELVEGGEKKANALHSILQALGVEDPDTALAALPSLMEAKAKLASVVNELETAIGINVDSETEAAEADVEQAMASRGWEDGGIKTAMLVLRGLNFPEKSDNHAKLKMLASGKSVFAEHYPTPDGDKVELLKTHVASPAGKQLEVSGDGAGVKLARNQKPGAKSVSLAGYPGRNTMERVMAYVVGNVAGANGWSREDVFTTACEMKKQIQFEDPDAAVG